MESAPRKEEKECQLKLKAPRLTGDRGGRREGSGPGVLEPRETGAHPRSASVIHAWVNC